MQKGTCSTQRWNQKESRNIEVIYFTKFYLEKKKKCSSDICANLNFHYSISRSEKKKFKELQRDVHAMAALMHEDDEEDGEEKEEKEAEEEASEEDDTETEESESEEETESESEPEVCLEFIVANLSMLNLILFSNFVGCTK